MLKTLQITFILFCSVSCFGTANSVYHEFTLNTTGGSCGTYVSNTAPTGADAVNISFTIDYQFFTNQARIYYTTDGSAPSASHGVPSGTTQVITASYFCTYNNGSGTVDVARGTIPALPTGTVVKYIVSAWHSSGGLEIFASGGSNTSSATATVFSYTVASVLPLGMVQFAARKENDNIKLFWETAQEINISHYEVYASANGINFTNIGTVKAAGNTGKNQYSFVDTHPRNGNNFYQVKIIDQNARYTFSQVIAMNIDKTITPSVYASAKTLHVRLDDTQKGNFSVALINNSGQSVQTWIIRNNSASTDYDLALPATTGDGIYHVAVNAYPLNPRTTRYSRSIFIQ